MIHYAWNPNVRPICGINEQWRQPGEPSNRVVSTDDPGQVDCARCLEAILFVFSNEYWPDGDPQSVSRLEKLPQLIGVKATRRNLLNGVSS